MLKPCVVDLSHWNVIPGDYVHASANLKLAREKGGIQGLIHKATEGIGQVDGKLKVRAQLAREAGLLFGTYHFLRLGDMRKQVDHYVNTVTSIAPDDAKHWLWVCDYEAPQVDLSDVAEFMGLLAQSIAPFQHPVLYTGFALKDKIAAGQSASMLTQYRLWLAHYADEPVLPKGWNGYFLWQYTDKGTAPGFAASTDLSAYEDTVEELHRAWTGMPPAITIGSQPPEQKLYTKTIRITSTAPITVEVYGDDHVKN